MLTTDVHPELVGRRVNFRFTDYPGTGVITEVMEDEFVKGVRVKFDKGIQWGDDVFTSNLFTARKFDELSYGLSNVHLAD